MLKLILILVSLSLFVSCSKDIEVIKDNKVLTITVPYSTKEAVESLKLEELNQEEIRESCTYTGFCAGCGIGYDGQYSCGYKHSFTCSGHRQVFVQNYQELYKINYLVEKDNQKITYSSPEKSRSYYRVLKELSNCQ